jgi:AraC-like DNA-binding protein
MRFDAHELDLNDNACTAERWFDTLRDVHGLTCDFDAKRPVESTVRGWKLGQVGVSVASLAALSLAPVSEAFSSWQGEWLFVKLVTAGYVDVQWRCEARRFTAGSLFAMDPARPFVETFPERAALTVLRVPKALLRERGVGETASGLFVGDRESADLRATRDLIQCVAGQTTAPGPAMRSVMGEQLLELVRVLMADPAGRTQRRSAQAIVHRAQRHIESHVGDRELDIAAIADAVHLSPKHLQRLFQAQGTSLMRYVWQIRLERAAQLLRNAGTQGEAIHDIAARCGFTTAAHFSRAFKQRYGESPSDFREAAAKA